MDFDARNLRPVAQAANVPVEQVTAVVAAALRDAYATTPNARPGVSVDIDVNTGRVELRAEDGTKLESPAFGSRATTAARQAIVSWMRDQERLAKVGRWGQLEGSVIAATVKAVAREGEVRLDAQGALAVLPAGETTPGEVLRLGQEVSVLLLAANVTDRDTVRLTVSRRQPALVTALFDDKLPAAGSQVRIVAVAREPGQRAKVACDGPGDPRSELVGPSGTIVRSVVDDLGGEKVDLVRYSADLAEYVAAAFSPAPVTRVEVVDPARRSVRVYVTPAQRPEAEGAAGTNARLAGRLTGARIELVAAI